MQSFTEYLISQNLTSAEGLGEAMRLAEEKYAGNLEKALIEKGVDEMALLEAKSKYYSLPKLGPEKRLVNANILKLIPEDSAKHYHLVPMGVEDGAMIVGITDPENVEATDALSFISGKNGMPFKLFVISEPTYDAVMENYKSLGGQVGEAISELDNEIETASKDFEKGDGKIAEAMKPGEEEKIVEEAPIIKIVAVILNNATEGNASDIHIENTGEKVKVRFRVDGILHTSLVLPLTVYAGVVARIKILAKMRLDEKRKPQDGGFSAKISGRKIDFRVSTLPSYYGEKIVLRILDTEKGVKPLDQLKLSAEHLKLIRDALAKPYGLILITGPTGSGKSTTLYSILNELDREGSNIVSLEDPVEYHIPDVNQSQVMPEIGYTFASGLRSILRQDPDIIMVGEIRDAETAQLAIQAALTGHLVFSTLHTNNAIGVVPRLIDMGIDPYLIAPTLILSVAQRLVRLSNPGSVKEAGNADQEALHAMAGKEFADLPPEYVKSLNLERKFTETMPTADCPSGVRGRAAVFEMYPTTDELRSLILKRPVDSDIYKLIRSAGFTTMKENAILKCLNGEISFQEIYTL